MNTLLPKNLFTLTFSSIFVFSVLMLSSAAFATPSFALNTSIPDGSGVHGAGNISFSVNVSETGTNVLDTSGKLKNLTFVLVRPDGTSINFTAATFNTTAGGTYTTPTILNSTNHTFFINFTQSMFGPVGTYTFTWIGVNQTGTSANSTAGTTTTINRTTQTLSVLLNGTADTNKQYDKGTDTINITINSNSTDFTIFSLMQVYSNFTGSNQSLAGNTSNSFNTIYNTTNTAGMTLGNYTIFANVSQSQNHSAGNSSTIFIILRDVSVPVLSLVTATPATANEGSVITMSMSIFDWDSSTASIVVTYPDSTTSTHSYGGGIFSFSTTSQTGTYSALFKSADSSGNVGSTTKTFVINKIEGGSAGGTSSGGSSSASGGDGEKETRVINIGPEKMFTVTMTKGTDHGIVDITIEVNNPANNVQISVQKLAGEPATVTQTVSGTAYRYLEISKSGTADTNVKGAKLKFQVEKSWVADNGIDVSTISLNRYSGGAWSELVTTLVTSDETTYTFESETPGFSTFAITGEAAAAEGTTPTTEETAAGEAPAGTTTEAAPTVQLPGGLGTLDTTTMGIIGVVIVIVIGAAFFMMKSKGKKGKK